MENSLVELATFTKESDDKLASIIQNMANEMSNQLVVEKADSSDIQVKAIYTEVMEKVNDRLNSIESVVKDSKADIDKVKEVTYVLATDDIKQRDLTNAVARRAFKFSGKKNSPKYKLFYRSYISDCYSHLYKIFGVRSYKRIKIDDFDLALKSVYNYHPTPAFTNKKLHDYIDQQDKGLLTEVKSNALNLYLEEINGGVSDNEVQ